MTRSRMWDALQPLFDAPARMATPVGEAPRPASKRMPARVKSSDPDTAWEAAASITEAAANELEQLILSAFRVYGPMTDEQLCAHLAERYGPTVVTARSRLYRTRALVATEHRRRTTRGRSAIVWAAA